MLAVSLRLLMILVVALWAAWPGQAQTPTPGYLGVEVKDLTAPEADALGWDTPRGAKIIRIVPGGPAAAAGLSVDDVIAAVDGVELENSAALIERMKSKGAGAEARLSVRRGTRERRVTATLTERPGAVVAQVDELSRRLPLMPDTGGHTGLIRGLAVTADGRFVVSAGDDKVIRVWDWRAQETVRRIRGAASSGLDGRLYALALSPDDRWLAVGGWLAGEAADRHAIRLYDFTSGELKRVLRGHADVIISLAFSPDGTKLLSGSMDTLAAIWDVDTGAVHKVLRGHQEPRHLHHVYGTAFSSDGRRAVTGAYDGRAMIWDVATGEAVGDVLAGHKDKIHSVAVQPGGSIVATGDLSGEIRLWNVQTGKPIAIPNRPAGPQANLIGTAGGGADLSLPGGSVGKLVFSPDGRYLLSTCGSSCTLFRQHTWDMRTGALVASNASHNDIILGAAMVRGPDGRWLVVAGGTSNQQILVWDLLAGQGPIAALSGGGRSVWSVGVQRNAIGWGRKLERRSPTVRGPIEWALTIPSDGNGWPDLAKVVDDSQFRRASATQGTVTIGHKAGGRTISYPDGVLTIDAAGVKAEVPRGPTDGYQHPSYTLTRDGRHVVSGGGNGRLIAYDLTGCPVAEFSGHTGDVWSVTADEHLLVSSSADQTVRLWPVERLADADAVCSGKPITEQAIPTKQITPLATLMHLPADDAWLMWTPEGYYAGSPGAERILKWQLNHGPDRAAEEITVANINAGLHRPDIVARALLLRSTAAAIEEARRAGAAAGQPLTFDIAQLLERRAPQVRLVRPTDADVVGGMLRLRPEILPVAARDRITSIRVEVDGANVLDLPFPDGLDTSPLIEVPLRKGVNRIRVVFGNEKFTRTSEDLLGTTPIEVTNTGPATIEDVRVLRILAIGVDRVGDAGSDIPPLTYAGRDVQRLTNAMRARLGGGYQSVVVKVLADVEGADGRPTAARINEELDWLEREAKPADASVVIMAGHGDGGIDYTFLAADARRSGRGWATNSVVKWSTIEAKLAATPGQRFLFVDTCRGANADNLQRLSQLASAQSIVAFMASSSNEIAMEDRQFGAGLFTHFLIEAIDRGIVAPRDLAAYVEPKVRDRARDVHRVSQTPRLFLPRGSTVTLAGS
jgi:WD40 repeat protein